MPSVFSKVMMTGTTKDNILSFTPPEQGEVEYDAFGDVTMENAEGNKLLVGRSQIGGQLETSNSDGPRETDINFNIPNQPVSTAETPSESTLVARLDKRVLLKEAERVPLRQLYRPTGDQKVKGNVFYRFSQVDIQYGELEGVPYGILVFRLEHVETSKRCVDVLLKGRLLNGDEGPKVSIKDICGFSDEDRLTLKEGTVKTSSTTATEFSAVLASLPRLQMKSGHQSSGEITLGAGQHCHIRHNKHSEQEFSINLSVDKEVRKRLGVVNDALLAVLLKLGTKGQCIEANFDLSVTYLRDNLRKDQFSITENFDCLFHA